MKLKKQSGFIDFFFAPVLPTTNRIDWRGGNKYNSASRAPRNHEREVHQYIRIRGRRRRNYFGPKKEEEKCIDSISFGGTLVCWDESRTTCSLFDSWRQRGERVDWFPRAPSRYWCYFTRSLFAGFVLVLLFTSNAPLSDLLECNQQLCPRMLERRVLSYRTLCTHTHIRCK